MDDDDAHGGRKKKLKVAVAVALRPKLFRGGAKAADDSCWILFDREFPTNPRLLVDAEGWAMVRVWSLYRSSDFGAPGHLPNEGGVLDQPAIMLDAFGDMSVAETWMAKHHPLDPKAKD